MSLRLFAKRFLKTAYAFGFAPGRNFIDRLRRKSFITVLTYHRVDDSVHDVNAVSPENFCLQMAFLKKYYRVVSVAAALDLLASGKNPEPVVVITFDDGYRDNYLKAMPVLLKFGLPACFFISSGVVGAGRHFEHDLKRLGAPVPPMSWDEVRQLAGQGFEIGSHTVSHARLSTCSPTELRYEITASKAELERQLEKKIDFFSFPFGRAEDFSAAAAAEVKKAGYRCNFSSFGGINSPTADPFALRRQAVVNTGSLLSFRATIEGWQLRQSC